MTWRSTYSRTAPTTTCTLSTILTDAAHGARRTAASMLASLLMGMVTACSGAAMPPERDNAAPAPEREEAGPVAGQDAIGSISQSLPTSAPAPGPKSSDSYAVSKVLGKRDRTLVDGKQVCEVTFVYAGREPENLFWEEPCADVDPQMMGRRELKELSRRERLDERQRKFIEAMPGDQLLYVGGGLSASVYPIDETGTSIEVTVAD